MRVVSWNLARNTTSREIGVHERVWRYLEGLDPDLAFLQEATPPAWARERWGTVMSESGDFWGSLILAKPTLDLQALDAPAEANLKGGLSVATGSVRVPSGGRVIVISVHAPVMKARAEDLAGRDLESVRLPHYPTASLRNVA